MFVYNVRLDGKNLFRRSFVIFLIIILSILIMSSIKVFNGAKTVGDSIDTNKMIYEVDASNYTNVLKAVNDNIDDYIGVRFSFIGYVYTLPDFKENQFVLARDMIVTSNYQALVVGFLCESEEIKNYSENTWVEITGEISKGYYEMEIPVIQILDIKETARPNDEYVYPPDNTYIPTAGMI